MESDGRPGRRGVILASNTAGEETGSVRHGTGGMAPVPPGTVEKKTMFSTKTPLADLKHLQTSPTANFGDLKEALKQFYIIHKNSCGLPLSFRSSTQSLASK